MSVIAPATSPPVHDSAVASITCARSAISPRRAASAWMSSSIRRTRCRFQCCSPVPRPVPVVVGGVEAEPPVKRERRRIVRRDLQVGACARRATAHRASSAPTTARPKPLPAQRRRGVHGEQSDVILFDFRQAAGDDLAVAADQRTDLRQRIVGGAIEQPRQRFAGYAEQGSRAPRPTPSSPTSSTSTARRGQRLMAAARPARRTSVRSNSLQPRSASARIEAGAAARTAACGTDRRQAGGAIKSLAVRDLSLERQRRPISRVDATQTLGRTRAMTEQPAVVEAATGRRRKR